ncbi:MAG: response regulator [Nitrospirae bacterium]|nr:response regulator [Nitrospirota bacterium]
MRILIVEDNADDRRLLKYNLVYHGNEVIEASDGLEGLEKAKTHKPDLIISDALMPRMDGFQFLRAVRQDESIKKIPFIFYSAVYTGHDEARLAISLGADEFIIKPKEPNEFWDEINSTLEVLSLKREKPVTAELLEEHKEFLEKYSQIVAAKLEEKVRELETAKKEIFAVQQRLQYLLSYAPAVIFSMEVEPPYDITFISENAAAQTGYDALYFVENRNFWADNIHPENSDRILKEFAQLFEKGQTVFECRFRRKDGTYIWLRDDARLVRDDNGKPMEIVVSSIEITERKTAEEETQKKMEELEKFYEASIGRELKMKELKHEIEKLKHEIERLTAELEKYKK